VTVKRSFDRISVDGQLSTNDTAILMASGASGVAVEPETEDELRFGESLDALLRQLALLIVRDGEGSRRLDPRRRARRRGRGRRARGPRDRQLAAGQDRDLRRRLELGTHRAGRRRGAARDAPARVRHPHRRHARVQRWLRHARAGRFEGDEVEVEVTLPGDGAETEVFFSDLGHEYITINADYTT
jgi:glutamate N-acetyltransferase/amino-acid N-acetyltransferase